MRLLFDNKESKKMSRIITSMLLSVCCVGVLNGNIYAEIPATESDYVAVHNDNMAYYERLDATNGGEEETHMLRALNDVTDDITPPEASAQCEVGYFILTANDEQSGILRVEGEQTGNVIFEPENCPKSFTSEQTEYPAGDRTLIVYNGAGLTKTVPLNVNDGVAPQILWAYKDVEQNCIYAGLKDGTGLNEIIDQDNKVRVRFPKYPLEKIARYELHDGDTQFTITDIGGNSTVVRIEDISLNVGSAYKNANGDKIIIELEDLSKGISKVTYLNGTEIEVNDDYGVVGKSCYEVNPGTTKILVFQDGGTTYAELQLELDAMGPQIEANNAGGHNYRNDGNGLVVINPVDSQSGLQKIVVGETTLEFNLDEEVLKQINIEDVTTLVFYDGLGNITEVEVNTLEEDTTKPTGTIEYVEENDEYIVTVQDTESGLWKLVKNELENDPYTNFELLYPQDQQTVTLDTILGLNKLEIYDAVGNVHEIDLSSVQCMVSYANVNEDGTKIALDLFDSRGIVKLGILDVDGNESIIEVFGAGQRRLSAGYDVPEGTVAVNVYFTAEDATRADLAEYTTKPMLLNGKASSLVGIRKVVYEGGEILEFTKNEPKVVSIEEGAVEVYDTVGNVAVVE